MGVASRSMRLILAFAPAALEEKLSFGLEDCLEYTWKYTDAYFGGEGNPGTAQSTRTRLNKVAARERCVAHDHRS